MFGRGKSKPRPTRGELLDRATRARTKGNRKKAVKALQAILEDNPEDWAVHCKLAPLQLDLGDAAGAWETWAAAARGYELSGFVDKALALLGAVVEQLPRQAEAWEMLADLHLGKERPSEAMAALLEGQHHLQARPDRAQAIRLLRRACELEPGHFVATVALARTLAREGHKQEAAMALQAILPDLSGGKARMVRYELFRFQPGPRTLWRWLFGGGG